MPTAKSSTALQVLSCWLLATSCWLNAPLHAGTGDVISLPVPGKKIKNNARLEVETNWVGGTGYRPVKVTVINSPMGPTTYDRDFRIVLRPRGIYTNFPDAAVEKIIEMPEGAASGSAWISVPQTNAWQSLEIDVYEGGSRINELSEIMGLRTPNLAWGSGISIDAIPAILFIDADVPPRKQRDAQVRMVRAGGNPTTQTFTLPDVRHWQQIAPLQPNGSSYMPQLGATPHDIELLRWAEDNETIEILPPDELPETWLDFTCLDIIVLSLSDAQTLAKKHPARWEAILKWAAVGCTLVIYDVGENLKNLAEVESLCQLPAVAADSDSDQKWREADRNYTHLYLRALQGQGHNGPLYDQAGNLIPSADLPQSTTNPQKRPFALRPILLGRVVAMSASQPLGNPPFEMIWALNQVDGRNWINYQRNGYSAVQDNGDFVNYLVAGTGRVPVLSFLILISLFSIVIGPVNYLLLKRWRRLYLLVVTVPLGAIAVTFSLFTYALISDGLGVRLRARSYTQLDQTTGQMTMWARQSYYAGLAPSGGLRYPTDAAVFAIDERPVNGHQRLRIWNDQQQLRAGYISSRRSAQFLVQTTGASTAKLEIQTTAGQPPRVVNLLGARIEHLLLRDKDGDYYSVGPIEPEQAVTLTSNNLTAGLKPFSSAYQAVKASPPDGYQISEYEGNLWGFDRTYARYYQYGQYNQRGMPAPNFAGSLLEVHLQRASQGRVQDIPKGTYRALLTTSPEMPLGYPNASERGSFHMLEGRW